MNLKLPTYQRFIRAQKYMDKKSVNTTLKITQEQGVGDEVSRC